MARLGQTIWTLCLVVMACASARAQPLSDADLHALAAPSVVFVETTYRDVNGTTRRRSGTGFIVSTSGFVLTAHHVVAPTDAMIGDTVRVNMHVGARLAEAIPVTMIRGNPDNDVALFRLPERGSAGWPALAIRSGTRVRPGDRVLALGFPGPAGLTNTPGTVGALNAITASGASAWLQLTAPLSEGNSGGPILDSVGNVIGITVRSNTYGQTTPYAIPLDWARDYLEQAGLASQLERVEIRLNEVNLVPEDSRVLMKAPNDVLVALQDVSAAQDEEVTPSDIQDGALSSVIRVGRRRDGFMLFAYLDSDGDGFLDAIQRVYMPGDGAALEIRPGPNRHDGCDYFSVARNRGRWSLELTACPNRVSWRQVRGANLTGETPLEAGDWEYGRVERYDFVGQPILFRNERHRAADPLPWRLLLGAVVLAIVSFGLWLHLRRRGQHQGEPSPPQQRNVLKTPKDPESFDEKEFDHWVREVKAARQAERDAIAAQDAALQRREIALQNLKKLVEPQGKGQ